MLGMARSMTEVRRFIGDMSSPYFLSALIKFWQRKDWLASVEAGLPYCTSSLDLYYQISVIFSVKSTVGQSFGSWVLSSWCGFSAMTATAHTRSATAG